MIDKEVVMDLAVHSATYNCCRLVYSDPEAGTFELADEDAENVLINASDVALGDTFGVVEAITVQAHLKALEAISEGQMTNKEYEMIRALRHRGFAVVIFHPEELGSANPTRVQDRLVELANQSVIDDLRSDQDDDEDDDNPQGGQR